MLAGGLIWWLYRGDVREGVDRTDEATAAAAQAPLLAPPDARPAWALSPRLADRATVSGTVTDTQGRPIADALVCSFARSNRLASGDTRKATCTRSGRDGRYRLESLFGVRQYVHASAPGHIAGPYVDGSGAARREYVDLRPGLELRDVDIALAGGGVEIRGVVKDLSGGAVEGAQVTAGHALGFSGEDGAFSLWVRPGATWVEALADGYALGHETGAAPGHVFQLYLTPEAVLVGKVVRVGDGAPVVGAKVSASGGMWGSESAAFTDESGAFRLDGLVPGAYKAYAEADDAVGHAEEQVLLGLGETSAPIVIAAHPAFFVEGTIAVAGGASCSQGRVNLHDRVHARDSAGVTEGDGVVRLRGLLPGEYEVNVRCDDHVPAERYEPITIADESVSGVRWEVTRGRSIRGQVVDPAGKPVAGVDVSAQPRADPGQPRAQRTSSSWGVQTDDGGRFEAAGLLPGVYDVSLSARQESRATPRKPLEVTLPEGQDVEGVRIELPATGEVRGAVRDPKGNPVKQATVWMTDGAEWHNAYAADDGTFAFLHVAAGEYRVVANRGWYDSMRAPGTTDDDVQGVKVAVQTGKAVSVALVVESAAGTLSGVVRDRDGGPVADVYVEASRESDSAAQAAGGAMRSSRWGSFFETPHMTDPDGRFTLTDLPAGKYTILAHRKGGGEAIREHVELGGEVELTFIDAGRMSGTVALRGGGAPEEFTVVLENEATGFRRADSFFRTGGAWSLVEVPAGAYKVRVTAGPGTAEVEASMTEGQDTSGVRVELAPKITVRGKLVGLEGEPVAGMEVHVSGGATWVGGGAEKLNVTDAEGRFEVERAPTGQVQITAWPQGWANGDYEYVAAPARIADDVAVVELPPIQVAKRRVKQGEASGDVGYTIKESEPGADPMAARLIVAVVRPGGPAAAAGLQVGDEIVSVDGHDVTGPRTYLHGSLTHTLPEATITLGLARGATVPIVVGKQP
jgi:protocatechuate 3,4-dioxygenase beta subunit